MNRNEWWQRSFKMTICKWIARIIVDVYVVSEKEQMLYVESPLYPYH